MKGQRVEAVRQSIHYILYQSEHPHATRPSLDMLAQRTERSKLAATVRLRAPVYLRLVGGALQVLIEAGEFGEKRVAHEAFERPRIVIPRAVCRPRRGVRSFVPSRPTDQSVGVCYDMVSVRTHDQAVELLARHARRAGTGLEVERECCNRDKCLIAAASRAHDVAQPVLLGVKMLLEVVLILETPAAPSAIVVDLVVMFLESRIAVK